MINLTEKSLPNTVQVNGRDFPIYTDFRIWLKFLIEFEEWSNGGFKGVLDIRYLFKNDMPKFYSAKNHDDIWEQYGGILSFLNPVNVIPKSTNSSGDKVLYYQYDGDYIYSAFLQQYGIDLLEVEDLHWHKFKALMNGLTKTKMNEIMEYRSYTGEKVKDMDSQYRRIKEIWTPPEVMSEEEKEAEDKFNDYFG